MVADDVTWGTDDDVTISNGLVTSDDDHRYVDVTYDAWIRALYMGMYAHCCAIISSNILSFLSENVN